MGTIVKRAGKTGTSYRAVVRLQGHTLTKTFAKRALATTWIRDNETGIASGTLIAKGNKLGGIIDSYYEKLKVTRPKAKWDHSTLRRFGDLYAHVDLASMDGAWWVNAATAWDVQPSSALRYILVLRSALRSGELHHRAKVDWKALDEGMAMLTDLGMVACSNERSRRPTLDELAKLHRVFDKREIDTGVPMNDIMDFAIATSMRAGEILAMRWEDLDEKVQTVDINRKHPTIRVNIQNVPVLPAAMAIIKRQPRTDTHIFPYLGPTVSTLFARARDLAGIVDLRFHDLRHEAISRFFEQGLLIQQVAVLSGHRNWKSLKRYTQISSGSIHEAFAKLPAWKAAA